MQTEHLDKLAADEGARKADEAVGEARGRRAAQDVVQRVVEALPTNYSPTAEVCGDGEWFSRIADMVEDTDRVSILAWREMRNAPDLPWPDGEPGETLDVDHGDFLFVIRAGYGQAPRLSPMSQQ